MDEHQENTQSPDEGSFEEIVKECQDAPGYILFSAALKSQGDNQILNFKYRRYHVNLEDLKMAFINFAETIKDTEDMDPVAILRKAGL